MLLRTLRSASAVTAGFAVAGAFAYTASSKPAETESKKVKLTYFDIPGRAFVIRAALRHANIPFEDVRISYPELVQARGPTGANSVVPLGQLPTLELTSGEIVCQSMPILRWAARQSDLYPKDINDALIVDELCESIFEVRSKLPDAKDDAEKKKLREDYAANVMPKYLNYLVRRLESRGGPYFMGKQFSMADLIMARFVAGIAEKKFDYLSEEVFAKWPALMKHFEATKAHPVYKKEVQAEEDLKAKNKSK